jgi:DNA-binding NarL/FixJ family response regulator
MRLSFVTNQPVAAAGLKAAMAALSEIEVNSLSPDDPRILDSIAVDLPDILLIDFIPEQCFGLLMALRDRVPNCRSILWVRKISPNVAYQAMNLGVWGIIRSTETFEVLEECIKAIARGEHWFDEDSRLGFFESRTVGLTPREAQLVILVAQGLKNKEIATVSGISEATVRIYLSALFRKLGVKDRYELGIYGMENMLAREPMTSDAAVALLPQRTPDEPVLFLERPRQKTHSSKSIRVTTCRKR